MSTYLSRPEQSLISPPDWISQAEAARLRGVSRQAIAKLVRSKRLESVMVGGRVLVNRDQVENFVRRRPGRPRVEKHD